MEKFWSQARDALVLTKSLGTGIIATGIKKGVATQDSIEDAINSMSSLNKYSAQKLRGYNVNAVTDVTGFGLLGHLKKCVRIVMFPQKLTSKT